MKTIGPYTVINEVIDGNEALGRYKGLADTNFAKLTGLTLPDNPKVLGQGDRGVAYDIGGGKVLKVTGDQREAMSAGKLINKTLPGLYRVFGVYKDNVDPYWHYIVQEKLTSISGNSVMKVMTKHLKKFSLDKLISDRGNIAWWMLAKDGNADWEQKIYAAWDEWLKTNKVDKNTKDIVDGLRSLTKAGITFYDLHPGNIMKSKRGLVIIDIGASNSSGGKVVTLKAVK